MEKSELKRRLLTIGTIFGGYSMLFLLVRLIAPFRLWPVWNLFLAFLPLVFSTLIVYSLKSKTPHRLTKVIIFAALWLLFLPNTFYYLTDLMWIAPFPTASHFRPENITNISAWATLMLIAIGEFLAVLAGVLALHDVHKVIAKRLVSWKTWLLLGAVFLLSGFAVYMGRFLRLNSWDVILPWRLVGKILGQFDCFALQFTLLMTVVIAVIYAAFWLIHQKISQSDGVARLHNANSRLL
jgi:uncharacterized membrane protein